MKLLSVASITAPVWKAHIADENEQALCGKKSIHRQVLIPGTVQQPNCIRCCELWNKNHPDELITVPPRKVRISNAMDNVPGPAPVVHSVCVEEQTRPEAV